MSSDRPRAADRCRDRPMAKMMLTYAAQTRFGPDLSTTDRRSHEDIALDANAWVPARTTWVVPARPACREGCAEAGRWRGLAPERRLRRPASPPDGQGSLAATHLPADGLAVDAPVELAPFRTGWARWLPRHQRAIPSAGLDERGAVYGRAGVRARKRAAIRSRNRWPARRGGPRRWHPTRRAGFGPRPRDGLRAPLQCISVIIR